MANRLLIVNSQDTQHGVKGKKTKNLTQIALNKNNQIL